MILDTNAVSAFFEDVPAVCMAVGGTEVLAVPSIVLGEYRFGLSGSRLRAELEAKLGRLERLADVLSVDAETGLDHGGGTAGVWRFVLQLERGTPIPAGCGGADRADDGCAHFV